jgi:hypothetical protein
MELFIEYQVPSDLLAYDGAENRDVAHKIAEVKRNVEAVQDMVKAAKQKELDEEKQKAEFERAELAARAAREEAEREREREIHRQQEEERLENLRKLEEMRRLGEERLRRLEEAKPARGKWAGAKRSDIKISAPSELTHNVHVDFNSSTGFGGLPVQWEQSLMSNAIAKMECVETVEALLDYKPPRPKPLPEPAKPAQPSAKAKAPGVPGKDDFVDEEAAIDYTRIPAAIDAKFDKLDEDGAVRPTKVEPGDVWRKKFQKALLAKPSETSLGKDETSCAPRRTRRSSVPATCYCATSRPRGAARRRW